jgi:hypothetical protein
MTRIPLLALIAALWVSSAAAQTRPQPAFAGMRAFLTRNKTGELSANVLDPAFDGLRNTIAGPNAADAMLVVVELSGPPNTAFTGAAAPKYTVRLIAREGKRESRVFDRTVPLPVLGNGGRAFVSFLVRQDGCVPVRLTASLVGPRTVKPLERVVNFTCGE